MRTKSLRVDNTRLWKNILYVYADLRVDNTRPERIINLAWGLITLGWILMICYVSWFKLSLRVDNTRLDNYKWYVGLCVLCTYVWLNIPSVLFSTYCFTSVQYVFTASWALVDFVHDRGGFAFITPTGRYVKCGISTGLSLVLCCACGLYGMLGEWYGCIVGECLSGDSLLNKVIMREFADNWCDKIIFVGLPSNLFEPLKP